MNEIEPRKTALEKRRSEVKAFLDNSIQDLRAGGEQTYDLITEFQKAKKNRSFVVPITIVVVLALVAVAAWRLTAAIDKQSRNVSIDIASFEDLNLKDLLDLARKSVDDLDRAIKDLNAMKADLAAGLDQIKTDLNSAKELNKAQGLSSADLTAKDNEAEQSAASKRKELQARLQPLIDAKQKEVDELQARVAAYDQRALSQAKEQQETLDNQQKLFDLEKQKIEDFYKARVATLEKNLKDEKASGEARVKKTIASLTARYEKEIADTIATYNPTWDDAASQAAVLKDAKDPGPLQIPAYRDLPAEFPEKLSGYNAVTGSYRNLLATLKRLRSVPYKNSIPPYLGAVEAYGNELAAGYGSLANGALEALGVKNDIIAQRENTISQREATIALRDNTIAAREATIAQRDQTIADLRATMQAQLAAARTERGRFEYGVTGLARREGDAGYVIDPRNSAEVYVYIDPLFSFNGSVHAWAFRQDDELVGELTVTSDGDRSFAKVVRLEDGMTLMPFDRVFLDRTSKKGTQTGTSSSPDQSEVSR